MCIYFYCYLIRQILMYLIIYSVPIIIHMKCINTVLDGRARTLNFTDDYNVSPNDFVK